MNVLHSKQNIYGISTRKQRWKVTDNSCQKLPHGQKNMNNYNASRRIQIGIWIITFPINVIIEVLILILKQFFSTNLSNIISIMVNILDQHKNLIVLDSSYNSFKSFCSLILHLPLLQLQPASEQPSNSLHLNQSHVTPASCSQAFFETGK